MKNKPKRAVTPWQRRRLTQMGVMLAVTAVMGVGLHVYIGSATSVAGTLLEVSETDAAAYGITQVYELDDGTYRVEGSAKGFASEVTTTVVLSADGTVQSVEVSAPGETETLGGQCMGEAFTGQFAGVTAPVTLNGKSFTVTDPATGAAYTGSTAEAQPEQEEAEPFDPADWNAEDTSPEAEAMRAMYSAGLTETAQKGEDLTTPWVDLSAEGKAAARLAQYELTVSQSEPSAQAAADLSGVDAVSGATLTSTAVANVVNGAYFYVRDVLAAQS